MTYDFNLQSEHERQLREYAALQSRVISLENQLTTAHTDLAQRDDRIATLEAQLVSAGEFHLAEMDTATARLVRERDEARAVAREMAEHHRECDDWGCRCIHCGARDYPKGMRHSVDCPVSKVRAWDAPITPPADIAPLIFHYRCQDCHALWTSDQEEATQVCMRCGSVRIQDLANAPDAPGFSAAHNPDV